MEDTRHHLVWSRSPDGEKLVGGIGKVHGHCRRLVTEEGLLNEQGQGVWLIYLPLSPLPTVSASLPVYCSS